MPGSSPTMARRDPTSRLNNVDLPTLGRPTMAMSGIDVMEFERSWLRPEHLAGPVEWSSTVSDRKSHRYYRDSVPFSSQPGAASASTSLYQFFAPGGLLCRTHPAYEFRRVQLQMAQAVEQAITERRHLIVE